MEAYKTIQGTAQARIEEKKSEFIAHAAFADTEEKALAFLKERPEGLEVALTGRDPAPELLELADYVSEIRKVKHPFDKGLKARKGIEL